MSRARHMGMKSKTKSYTATSNVEKEAMERKHGGRATKEVEKPEAGKSKKRMDRRPRCASGGRVGADKAPFSSAARPGQNTEAAKP